MSLVTTAIVAHSLKETLNDIMDDEMDLSEANSLMPHWMDEEDMDDAYVDDLEMGGPGLITEKPEGSEMQTGTINEGYVTRYLSRTFALKVKVTREAIEDAKYKQVINMGKRLTRAAWKTVDYDSTNVLVRMFDTNYPGGDGLPLGSASHTLPSGGTFSNLMATPMSPSRMAITVAYAQLQQLSGHDGLVEGYNPRCIMCPVQQWAAWTGIVKSTHAPEPGAFNEINVVNTELDIDVVSNKYWRNTQTNWALLTDADGGLKWFWRRRIEQESWVDNAQAIMNFGISYRAARGWSDPRVALCVQA